MKSSIHSFIKQEHFDGQRFLLLLKLELFKSRFALALTLLIISGLMLEGIVLDSIIDDGILVHFESFCFNYLLGGFVLSSLAYRSLSRKLTSYQYLMMPVSNFEKFLSMWLLTSVGWTILFLFYFPQMVNLVNLVAPIIRPNVQIESFDLFSYPVLNTIQYYFVLQGIFLVGATHFRGFVFPKTLLAVLVYALLCVGIFYFMMYDLLEPEMECNQPMEVIEQTYFYYIGMSLVWFFWWGLAPLCWLITFLGLKDQKV